MAPASTTSSSENRILSSYPDAVGIPETIISSTNFWHFIDSFLRFVSSSRSSEDEMCFSAKDCRNYSPNQQQILHLEPGKVDPQLATYLAKTPPPSPCLETGIP